MSATVFDVVVVGGANTDFLVQGEALPTPGSTVSGSRFQEAPGGKGANQAVGVARLGASVALVTRLGDDDRGRTIAATLKNERVDTRAVTRDAEAVTGVALVMVDGDGRKQIMTAPGANLRLTVEHIAQARDLLARARALLIQFEVPLPAVSAAIQIARSAGARIVLDPAPPLSPPDPIHDDLLRQIDVIRPNAVEAEALTGVRVTDRESARQAAAQLLRRGVGAVVLAAPGGNLLVSPEQEDWLPHIAVKAVDETGAGDAFAAAVAFSPVREFSLYDAARFASAAAAATTRKLGAQAGLPTYDEVMELL